MKRACKISFLCLSFCALFVFSTFALSVTTTYDKTWSSVEGIVESPFNTLIQRRPFNKFGSFNGYLGELVDEYSTTFTSSINGSNRYLLLQPLSTVIPFGGEVDDTFQRFEFSMYFDDSLPWSFNLENQAPFVGHMFYAQNNVIPGDDIYFTATYESILDMIHQDDYVIYVGSDGDEYRRYSFDISFYGDDVWDYFVRNVKPDANVGDFYLYWRGFSLVPLDGTADIDSNSEHTFWFGISNTFTMSVTTEASPPVPPTNTENYLNSLDKNLDRLLNYSSSNTPNTDGFDSMSDALGDAESDIFREIDTGSVSQSFGNGFISFGDFQAEASQGIAVVGGVLNGLLGITWVWIPVSVTLCIYICGLFLNNTSFGARSRFRSKRGG